MTRVAARAHAKLTLSLRITGVRAGGYHELDALVVATTEPHDSLAVERAEITTVVVGGRHAADVPDGRASTARRAADALGVTASIRLDKGIPAQGGLGGGSADAAATLLALRELHSLDVDDAALARLGVRIGADVPVCMARGPQRMRGIGDVLEPASVPDLWFVIATPPYGASTPDVYRAWDELGGPHADAHATGLDGLAPLANDLEPAAWHVEPRLERYRAELEEVAEAPVVLAGSGSSYVALYDREPRARAAARRVDETMGVHTKVAVCATVAPAGVVLSASD